ncbi:MAG: hypothetical protein KF806_04975 [Nitrospira sp.]|nr:hypothetical protein [Nitrospira sp.]
MGHISTLHRRQHLARVDWEQAEADLGEADLGEADLAWADLVRVVLE